MMMFLLLGKKLISAMVVVILAGLIGWRACNQLLVDGAQLGSTRVLHDLSPSMPARFVIRGARDLHLVTYYVLTKGEPPRTQYSLQLSFFAPDGALREQRSFYLSIDPSPEGPQLPDGTKLGRVRLLRVSPPVDTTVLSVSCPDGRVLLQAGWLTSRHPSREALLRRSGVPATWLATDELDEIRSQRFQRLSEIGQVPSISLPMPDPSARSSETLPRPAEPLRVGPHRALVWNVIGPGSIEVRLPEPGSYSLESIGVNGSGHAGVQDGHAELELPAGPSSVILRPRGGSTSTVQLMTQKLRPLEGPAAALLPAERWVSGWRADGQVALRFPMYGRKAKPLPIRLSARALAVPGEPVHWRFLDAEGHRLLAGELSLEELFDAFSGLQSEEGVTDLRLASQVLLVPPKGTAVLAIDKVDAAVEVDVLLEDGAQSGYLPPYDIDLKRGLHFRDAPGRRPRWLMLSPLGTEDEQRHLRLPMLRMPRIEPITLYHESGPWLSLEPRGGDGQAQVAEPTLHFGDADQAVTMAQTAEEVPIVVPNEGHNAHRVVMTCDLPDKLGGRLSLYVDGHRVSSAPILLGTLRLEATTTAGVHRVRAQSPLHGNCAIEAPAAEGAQTVRRKIYRFAEQPAPLRVRVSTHHHHPMRVYYALYTDDPEALHRTSYAVQVDGGPALQRTAPPTSRPHGAHAPAVAPLPVHMLHTHQQLYRVAESLVLLGGELSAGRHQVALIPRSQGHYWARFWIHGHRHADPKAEAWISSESLAHAEGWE